VKSAQPTQDGQSAPVVVALGGNTLLEEGAGPLDEQRSVIRQTAARVADVVEGGHNVVLTHGNGPQVGNLLLQQECADGVFQRPLDVLVAETQAQIGYLLQQALTDELPDQRSALTVVTQTVVDADDRAFQEPTKPVGPFYTETEAAAKPFETRRVTDGERPCRRVVPSPEPRELVESDEIAGLVERGTLPICAGGGGVPVVRDEGLRGIEAVVDKDRASQVLASELGAGALVVLTDVEHACVNYGEPDQRPLGQVTAGELRGHLAAGEFGAGSMQPKVEACLRFVEAGGDRAVITSPDKLCVALDGDAGTQIRE